jgi:uroporphyrinogen decarboxylase
MLDFAVCKLPEGGEMTAGERVIAAVEHREPDRVPLMYRDVPEVRERLKRDLRVTSDDELFEAFDIDVRWVGPQWIGPELEISEDSRRDAWGVEWKYTRFSETGGYWNELEHPLIDAPDAESLDRYRFPDITWWDFSGIAEACERYRDYAIMTAPGEASPGILQYPIQTLIGVERSLTDLYLDPPFLRALVAKVLEFRLPFIDRMLSAGKFDFFRIGDDYGTQNGPLIGVDLWNEFFREPLSAMFDSARRHGARSYLHSCGSVRSLIPSLISIGVDVLDPVQVAAAGMDPAALKRDFGSQVAFSGGVDEQDLLPRGTREEIREYVYRLLEVMMPGGGFILGPTHNLQDDIPTGNIVAMYEAARSWPG